MITVFVFFIVATAILQCVSGFHRCRIPFNIVTPTSISKKKSWSNNQGLKAISSNSNSGTHEYDVAVLGGGPAGTTIAWLLQEQYKLKVALIDPRGDRDETWYPNYGEWQDEWHWLADRLNLPEMKTCTTNDWDKTDCFFGGNGDVPMTARTRLSRAYVRVDRVKLQKLLRSRFKEANGKIIRSKVTSNRVGPNLFDQNILHLPHGTRLTLDNAEEIESKIVIDATGFESKFISKENPMMARGSTKSLKEGYQIAYGFIAHCSGTGPYDADAMTLFDYRTDHLDQDPAWRKDGEDRPTFMYVMPLSKNADGSRRVFWEETSLVGVGKRRLSFAECKRRAMQRLRFHNIDVYDIEEEEYCYIPMGGELPDLQQRIIAFGGAANMVHPATGYHVCRMMAAAKDLAATISDNMALPATENSVTTAVQPDKIALLVYQSMWSSRNRLQRDFQAFGGDFLMRQDVENLRGFFSAFFQLEQSAWSGFLAGWPGLPNNDYHASWDKRLLFALSIFLRMPAKVAIGIITYSIQYTLEYGPNTLLRSLLPTFVLGEGPAFPKKDMDSSNQVVGDMDAKNEARQMMREFSSVKAQTTTTALTTAGSTEEIKMEILPAPYDNA